MFSALETRAGDGTLARAYLAAPVPGPGCRYTSLGQICGMLHQEPYSGQSTSGNEERTSQTRAPSCSCHEEPMRNGA